MSASLLPYFVLIFFIAKITEKKFTASALFRGLIGRDDSLSPSQALLVIGMRLIEQVIVVCLFFYIAYGISSSINEEMTTVISPYIPLGLSAAGVIAAIIIANASIGSEFDDSGVHALMNELEMMGQQDVIMPAEIFNLARRMVDYPDQEGIAIYLEEGYEYLTHHFQQRVFFTYLRFSGGNNLHIQNPNNFILEGINHEKPWVRYDAVWAYLTLNDHDAAIHEQLEHIASEHPSGSFEKDDGSIDAEASFYKCVHEALANVKPE